MIMVSLLQIVVSNENETVGMLVMVIFTVESHPLEAVNISCPERLLAP